MRQVAEIAEGAAQTADDVIRVAALLFVNYIDAANTVAESCGGVESNWGRRKDEDDEWYARRCIEKANWLCKPMRRNIDPKR